MCAASVFLCPSCGEDEDAKGGDMADTVALQVYCGINVPTRALYDVWESGDAIGIYMQKDGEVKYANRQYVTLSDKVKGDFMPAGQEQNIFFPSDGSNVSFIAYYPYKDDMKEDCIYSIDVKEQEKQESIDIMGAARQEERNKLVPRVPFTFEHKLAKLILSITTDASMNVEELKDIEIVLTRQRTKATYHVVDGGAVKVDVGQPVDEIDMLVNSGGNTAHAIVLPAESIEGMMFHLELENGLRFDVKLTDAANVLRFDANKKYHYEMVLGKDDITLRSNVTDWKFGHDDDFVLE